MLTFFTENILQKSYIETIYSFLKQEIKNNFDVIVISSHPNDYNKSLSLINKPSKPKIIFDLADEWHRIPEYYHNNDIILILKEYAPFNYSDYKKLIPLPVYYNYKSIKQVPIHERKQFFYSNMWLTPSRILIKNIFDQYKNHNDYCVIWNGEFSKGIPNEEYLRIMQNTIVTICPNGYMSPEVSKLSEALMCGNIIICNKKPDYPYYKNNSFFIYNDEKEIVDILKHIKSLSIKELENIVIKNNNLFEEHFDPAAIALNIEKYLI
jgi:hypothetical protein